MKGYGKRPVHGMRATNTEWAIVKRFKKCLEDYPSEAENALVRLEMETSGRPPIWARETESNN